MANVEVKFNQQTASLPVVVLEVMVQPYLGEIGLNILDSIGVKFATLA